MLSYAIIQDMSTDQIIQTERFREIADHPLTLKNWYIETFPSNFTMEYHSHPQIEIMYCLHGAFDFMYKSDPNALDTQSISIRSNSLILVNTGYYHKVANMLPSTRIINLEFLPMSKEDLGSHPSKVVRQLMLPPALLAESCPKLRKLLRKDRDFYIFVDDNTVQSTMNEIISKTKEPDTDETLISIALLTSKLFLDISHCISPETHIKTGIVHVDTAMMYINAHFMNRISVQDIATATGISKVYLQKLFRNEYGKTVHQVLLDKRLTQAKQMLEQTNLSICAIAEQCGFGSREQLTTVFHQYESCSPQSYRKTLSMEKIRHFSHVGEQKLTDG